MRSEEDLRSCCDRAKEAGDYGAYLQAKSELVDFYRETFRFEEAFSAAEDVLMLMEELNLERNGKLCCSVNAGCCHLSGGGKRTGSADGFHEGVENLRGYLET